MGREAVVLPYAFVHILHVNDGIVNKRSDSYAESAEAHGVDGKAKDVQHQYGGEQGYGDGDERDDGSPHIGKEEEKYDNHEDGSFYEGLPHIVDTALYEA